jgi:hypothetical protein
MLRLQPWRLLLMLCLCLGLWLRLLVFCLQCNAPPNKVFPL